MHDRAVCKYSPILAFCVPSWINSFGPSSWRTAVPSKIDDGISGTRLELDERIHSMADAADQGSQIDTVMQEKRLFPPPKEFA